jgi:hypothetical protein
MEPQHSKADHTQPALHLAYTQNVALLRSEGKSTYRPT